MLASENMLDSIKIAQDAGRRDENVQQFPGLLTLYSDHTGSLESQSWGYILEAVCWVRLGEV